jgi:hypothetical protein
MTDTSATKDAKREEITRLVEEIEAVMFYTAAQIRSLIPAKPEETSDG